jgi:hypothetical protein
MDEIISYVERRKPCSLDLQCTFRSAVVLKLHVTVLLVQYEGPVSTSPAFLLRSLRPVDISAIKVSACAEVTVASRHDTAVLINTRHVQVL